MKNKTDSILDDIDRHPNLSMPKNRFYTDQEFSAILKRATELQQSEGLDDTRGLSLVELELVAEDVGIDPDFVRRAAYELEQAETDERDRLLGGPTNIDLEWIVDGELTETKWVRAVGEMQRTFAADGQARRKGRVREWIHRDQMGARVHLSMSSSGSRTRVRISYRMTEWLWLHFIMLCVAIGPVAVQYALLDLGALVETGIALFIMLTFYMIGWLTFRIFSGRQDRKMRKLRSRLDSIVAESESIYIDQDARIPAQESDRVDAMLLSDEVPSDDASSVRGRDRAGR